MLARVAIFSVVLWASFFGFYWLCFQTNLITRFIIKEVVKTVSFAVLAVISTAVILASIFGASNLT